MQYSVGSLALLWLVDIRTRDHVWGSDWLSVQWGRTVGTTWTWHWIGNFDLLLFPCFSTEILPATMNHNIHTSVWLAASLQYYIFGKERGILLQPNLNRIFSRLWNTSWGSRNVLSEIKSSHGWINYLDIVAAFSFLLEINPLILSPLVSSG